MPEQVLSENTGSGISEAFDFEEPPECKVVLYNDDYTTMEFVIEILVEIFHKSVSEAEAIMMAVHQAGKGIAGIYTYDIAVTRANMATSRARKNGFPLRVEAEKA